MKENDVLQIFLRWLKTNNIFHLFVYNTKYRPSTTYTVNGWLNYIKNTKIYGARCLMNYAPFDFLCGKTDYPLKNCCGEDSWYNLIAKWEKYVKENKL